MVDEDYETKIKKVRYEISWGCKVVMKATNQEKEAKQNFLKFFLLTYLLSSLRS